MNKTQRSYTCVETGIEYGLYKDEADRFHLIVDKPQGPNAPSLGTEKNGFYLAVHMGVVLKTSLGNKVKLAPGQFYPLKEGEQAISRKFDGFNKFTRV